MELTDWLDRRANKLYGSIPHHLHPPTTEVADAFPCTSILDARISCWPQTHRNELIKTFSGR